MTIQTIGLNHQIQVMSIESWGPNGKPQAFEKDQKDCFVHLLRERMSQRRITLVCEEARTGETSLAQDVCEHDGCAYLNIEMTLEERQRHNIPPGYAEDDAMPQAEKDRGNAIREADMVARILAAGQERVLVLCGRMHAEPLAGRLLGAGHTVGVDDLQSQEWYVEDWMEHILRNF